MLREGLAADGQRDATEGDEGGGALRLMAGVELRRERRQQIGREPRQPA